MSPQLIKVAIIDDHARVRTGIKNLLERADDIEVVAEAGDGYEALRLSQDHALDVILLDVELPGLRGDEVLRRLQRTQPGVKVLAVSSYSDPEYIRAMLENGAVGYLTKDEAPDLLVRAIRSVAKDPRPWLSPRVARQHEKPELNPQTLTHREAQIFSLLVAGKTDAQIRSEIGLSPGRFEGYIQFMYRKYNLDSRQDLVALGQRLLNHTNH